MEPPLDEVPVLKLLLPGVRNKLVPISTTPFSIGRRHDNHLVLPDEDISRVQVLIRRDGNDYTLEDQKSLFGTAVNGRDVESHILRNRDVIALGRGRAIQMVFLHADRMSRILNEVDRTPERETSRVQLLLEISKGLNSFTSLTDLLELALDAVIDVTHAERGFVMLRDQNDGLRMQVARNMAGEKILPENMRISMSIVSEAVGSGRPVFLTDALERSDLREKSSIAELNLRAIACLPLILPAAHMFTRAGWRRSNPSHSSNPDVPASDILGVIYTDSSETAPLLTDINRALVDSIAGHAAVAVETFLLRQEELEHRLLEREMEKLREVDRLKSDFVSHVSHELRTPLTAIKGAIDNMLDGLVGTLNEKQTRYLKRMKGNTEHLVRLIEDILDLSRIEAGQIALHPRRVRLFRLVGEVCDSLGPLASHKKIDLAYSMPEEITLSADRDRLLQILLNLAGNAIKFTPEGGKVRIEARESSSLVLLSVSDSGPGVRPEEKPHLFDRFFRAPTSEADGSEGTGLGLAIARSLAELHGGSISVESEPGKGSTFTVSLPLSGPAGRGKTKAGPPVGTDDPHAAGASPAPREG
jgi:signal transduction histidine kinase